MAEWAAHVDESGSGPGARGKPGRFVLACIAGSPEAIAGIEERIRRLKPGLVPGLDPADWELHAGDMFHGRMASPLGSMTTAEKMAVMRRIVDIVRDSDAVTFIVAVTGVRTRGRGASTTRTAGHAMALLADRLEGFARGRGRMTLRVVSDNAPEGQRLAMARALGRRDARAVTGIEFADSRPGAMLQVADAMAYAINRDMGGDTRFRGMHGDIRGKAWRPARHA